MEDGKSVDDGTHVGKCQLFKRWNASIFEGDIDVFLCLN